jgi:hypothetical protein
MARYRQSSYARKAYVLSKIRLWAAQKAAAESIPENLNVFRPRPSADAVVKIKIKGQPQIQFSTYKTPWGGWSVSPTLAGKKVQQVLMRA